MRLLASPSLLLLAAFLAVCEANNKPFTKFKECKGEAKVLSAKVTGCEKSSKNTCEVKSGSEVTVAFEAKAAVAAKEITAKVYGVLGETHFPFPNGGLAKNICDEITKGSCPLKKKDKFHHELKLKIPSVIKMDVTAEIRFENEDGKVLACAQIPTKLK